MAADLTSIDILLVDNDRQTREVLDLMLTACGARVRAVASLHDALAACDDDIPDVIVSDLAMPGVDGCEVLQALWTRSRCAGVPAIAVTGSPHHRERALAAGFSDVLSKPVDLDVLCDAILRRIAR